MKKQQVDASTLIKRIREYQAKNKLSLFTLATKSGLHRNTLRNLHSKDWNPSSYTLNAVIEFLDSDAA